MEVQLLNENEENKKLSFVLRDSTPYFANILRRLIIEEVPTLAIEDVEVVSNDSALYDEMLALRLGLIPIKTDLKSYDLLSECGCKGKGCAKCTLKLTLKSSKTGYVYADELKSKDPKCKPVYPKMPITKLLKNQQIELIATAILGQGKEHAKWIPAHVYYINEPEITVNNESSKFNEFKDKYPPKVFNNGKIDKALINSPNLIDACDGICNDVVKINYNKNNFIFYIESWGQLEPKEIVKKAVEIFEKKLAEFEKLLKQ